MRLIDLIEAWIAAEYPTRWMTHKSADMGYLNVYRIINGKRSFNWDHMLTIWDSGTIHTSPKNYPNILEKIEINPAGPDYFDQLLRLFSERI